MIDPEAPGWIFRDQSHIGVISADLDRTLAEYGLLGYTFAVRSGPARLWRAGIGVQEPFVVRSAWSLQGPPHIEVSETADVGHEPFIWPARGGDYVDHAGYWVDDLTAASARLVELGFPLELTPASDAGGPIGFCYHRTPSGARIELEDGPMRKALLAEQFARVRSGDTSTIEYVPFTRDST